MVWTPPGPALLFCPADRPDRFGKAAARADAVILDLEDAVAPSRRPQAREAVAASRLDPQRTIIRVNPAGTPDHDADLAVVRRTNYGCVMLAKTESAEQVTAVHEAVGTSVLALVETPLGVVRADQIAAATGCAGLMWGAEDLLAGMGGSMSRVTASEAGPGRARGQYRDVPHYARARVAIAAAAFDRWTVDAVFMDIADTDGLRAEAYDAVALGFTATGCIHPSQVAVVRAAYAPTADQVSWADRVLAAAADHPGVFRLDDRMIDGPLLRQAESIRLRARAARPGE